jgi:hypothetical protein
MLDPSIYRPFARLVRIAILGREFEVPENNILLRCFQYIAPGVPYGPFCWNGDCENDRIGFRHRGSPEIVTALSCQTLVRDGMEIVEISPDLARVLATALRGEASSPANGPSGDPGPKGNDEAAVPAGVASGPRSEDPFA